MDLPLHRDSGRTLGKKRSSLGNTLTISLSPERASHHQQQRSITSPVKSSSATRLTHSSLVSPEFITRSASASSPQHHRTVSGSRPSPSSIDYGSMHSEARTESALTVRPPTSTLERGGTPPLTPFPPWVSEEEDEGDEECENRTWENSTTKRHSYDGGHVPVTIVRVEGRWVVSSVIHGLVLVLQFAVTLCVFSALMWITVWKENEPGNDFDNWLWKFADPSLVIVLLLCSTSLIIHEVKLLSSVALLYLESLILVATTVASFVLWTRCFQEESRSVKGVLMGSNFLMWGLAFFGFVRAVVIWKVDAADDDVDQERAVMYGTFVPWDERIESL
ncbi:uncharacterized protein B0J16DRAFT_372641 [Fusarium flagelliforme]|uniref:Uncharacterized protein n=1 Tax=Fusarium flagelliforme TaxID=2675880 RepID=A0A395MTZ8_9HYPO|nr:uncharacterized protein B0J16DRAFT_372641 [Fusarium flagelliforme]KAH7185885.1 hypothetical protein B0J16DRAFT_372641 [Fusarium flagelliforme]RFN51197.1 hypothetical protein FIE12Z_4515 [Fusarium flagelliforme]